VNWSHDLEVLWRWGRAILAEGNRQLNRFPIITASTAGKITVRYTVQYAYCIYDYNRLYTYYLVPWNHMTCDLAILTHQLIPLMLQVEVIHFRFHVSIYVNPSIHRVATLHIVLSSGVAVLQCIPKSRGGRTALVGNIRRSRWFTTDAAHWEHLIAILTNCQVHQRGHTF